MTMLIETVNQNSPPSRRRRRLISREGGRRPHPTPGRRPETRRGNRCTGQLVNSSFTPSNSIAKAPTARAMGESHGRARLSRITVSSTTFWSLFLTAWLYRFMSVRAVRHHRLRGTVGCSRAFPSTAMECLSVNRHLPTKIAYPSRVLVGRTAGRPPPAASASALVCSR
jgi:hypothetical protein